VAVEQLVVSVKVAVVVRVTGVGRVVMKVVVAV
jgi:hypothetical protein